MVTLDSNVIVYAVTLDEKRERALEVLLEASFISAQVLNEYVNVARRKLSREWHEVRTDLELIRTSAGRIAPVDGQACQLAVELAERYQLAPYDAVLIAVALENGATSLYSEDMHHGLVIDGKLTITNPFRPEEVV